MLSLEKPVRARSQGWGALDVTRVPTPATLWRFMEWQGAGSGVQSFENNGDDLHQDIDTLDSTSHLAGIFLLEIKHPRLHILGDVGDIGG
jgi:hypothetical protein